MSISYSPATKRSEEPRLEKIPAPRRAELEQRKTGMPVSHQRNRLPKSKKAMMEGEASRP